MWRHTTRPTVKRVEVEKNLRSHHPDLLLIVETWLNPRLKLRLDGYTIFRNDRINRQGGGTAILVKAQSTAEEIVMLPKPKSFEATAIQNKFTDGSSMVVAAAYRSSISLDQREFESFLSLCCARSSNVVVTWTPNTLIGHALTRHRKETSWSTCEENELAVNRSRFPSRMTNTSSSFIDLFLTSHGVINIGHIAHFRRLSSHF